MDLISAVIWSAISFTAVYSIQHDKQNELETDVGDMIVTIFTIAMCLYYWCQVL